MITTENNAVVAMLLKISQQWSDFADSSDARILRWLVSDEEARMVDVFLSTQNEEISDLPDLFIRFDENFTDGTEYDTALGDSLIAQVSEADEDLASLGIDTSWNVDSASGFLTLCQLFKRKFGEDFRHLVIVLVPDVVSDIDNWCAWIDEALEKWNDTNIRFLLVDSSESPSLNEIAAAHPDRLISQTLFLDVPGAMLDLASNGSSTDPGVEFRRQFVQLSGAAQTGDIDKAENHAKAALAVAREHDWWQMQVTVHMALGGAQIGANETDKALDSYEKARAAAQSADAAEEESAPKLQLVANLACASILLEQAKFALAAAHYEESAPLAAKASDDLMEMECWRMAAYCHRSLGSPGDAARLGENGLEAAARLDEQLRASSTLAHLANGLIEDLGESGDTDGARAVARRMDELCGSDWRSSTTAPGQLS